MVLGERRSGFVTDGHCLSACLVNLLVNTIIVDEPTKPTTGELLHVFTLDNFDQSLIKVSEKAFFFISEDTARGQKVESKARFSLLL